jgi:hypothetical protein
MDSSTNVLTLGEHLVGTAIMTVYNGGGLGVTQGQHEYGLVPLYCTMAKLVIHCFA